MKKASYSVVRQWMWLILLLTFTLGSARLSYACGCNGYWFIGTSITGTASINNKCICVGGSMGFTVEDAQDRDVRVDYWTQVTTYPEDTLTYEWTASSGTISGSGYHIVWTAPDQPQVVTITCRINDMAIIPVGECGDRNDEPPLVLEWVVYVNKGAIWSDGYHVSEFNIPANEDDDNNNGVIDYRETGPDEGELKPIQVYANYVGGNCPFHVEITSEFGGVSVFQDSERQEPISLPYDEDVDGQATFWVQGLNGSSLNMRLEGGGGCVDGVRVEVIAVDLNVYPYGTYSDILDGDIGEQAPPGWPPMGCIVPYKGYTPLKAAGWSGNQLKLEALSDGDKLEVQDMDGHPQTLPLIITGPALWGYLKGLEPSGQVGSVRLRLSEKLPGPHQYVSEDLVKVTVAQADVAINNRTESNEDSLARSIALNDDDDNLNSSCDLDDHPFLGAQDDELVSVTYAVRPQGVEGIWHLDDNTHTHSWNDLIKSSNFVNDGWISPESLCSGTIYLEGYRNSYFPSPTVSQMNMYFLPWAERGPYSYYPLWEVLSEDHVLCSVINPDITLSGLSDCEELTVGGYVRLNDDDDDGTPGIDNECTSPTASEDPDLVPLTISFWGAIPEDFSKELTLSFLGTGADKIKFWSDNKKTEQVYPGTFYLDDTAVHGVYSLLRTYGNSHYTREIYVEGFDVSTDANDIILQIAYRPTSLEDQWYIDKLKFTVPKVVIVSPVVDSAVMISTNPNMEVNPNNRYPSSEQAWDQEIQIKATVVPPMPGFPIYLRSVDIDDESPYETDLAGSDNADGPGVLEATAGYTYEGGTNEYLKIYTDANGEVRAHLRVTDHSSGDNYAVCARAFEWPSETEIVRTGKLVAWKRVYLESDRMFVKGAPLSQNVAPGATSINVAWYDVLDYDGVNMFEGVQTILLFDSYGHSEYLTVSSTWIFVGSSLQLNFSTSTQGTYSGNVGIGVIIDESLDSSLYKSNTDWLARPFGAFNRAIDNITTCDFAWGGAFVDVCLVPDALNACKYMPHINVLGLLHEPTVPWFDNTGEPNVIHSVSVCRVHEVDNEPTGLTEYEYNISCVAVGKICDSCGGVFYNPSGIREIGQVLAHELGHQFALGQTDANHEHHHIGTTGDVHCIMDYHDSFEHQFDWGIDGPCEFCIPHAYEVRRFGDPL